MKSVVTDNNRENLSESVARLPASGIFTTPIHLLMVAGILFSASLNAGAATQGKLYPESSGSIGIRLTIPDRLEVDPLSDGSHLQSENSLNTLSGSSELQKFICVQGTGIEHYSVSVSGNNGDLILSSDDHADIPYQVTWNHEGQKVIIPAGDNEDRLIIKTDERCDAPSSVKIEISNQQAMEKGSFNGATILNIGVE